MNILPILKSIIPLLVPIVERFLEKNKNKGAEFLVETLGNACGKVVEYAKDLREKVLATATKIDDIGFNELIQTIRGFGEFLIKSADELEIK